VINGKTVLVTGGTGSFGKHFIKTILRAHGPKKVIVLSRDELKQYEMAQEITDERIRFFLGDVRDRDRLLRAFDGVDIVVHAAALKQVPAAEYNPFEFVQTNILGTENVLGAAIDRGVEKVLALSSDKAAAPVTSYGATKAVVEHLVRAGQYYSTSTQFAALRYGNVAGSRGSVIPSWRALIESGASRLPVTDERMTRFFFTLGGAVDFALWSLQTMRGGELFVPKMPSFYVKDLATAMGCDYVVTGTRTVEKLAEVMVTEEEARYFRAWQGRFVRFRDGHEKGEILPDMFEYRSDKNDRWLDVDQLAELSASV
jgi:UDP-N-acetylglucosamine 4,6-dehydratase/5-epimerase